MAFTKFPNQGQNFSQADYDSFKERALNHSIVRNMVPVSQIEIIDQNHIGWQSITWQITDDAFKALVRLLGFTNAAYNMIDSNLGSNQSKEILSKMKEAIANDDKKSQVCMLFDQSSAKIVNFTRSASNVLSNGAFFDLFERTMNNHSGMVIKNMAITEAGNVELSVLNENWEFNVAHFNEEFFKSGLYFINTPTKTIINPFNERLTCTNGMVTAEKGLSIILSKGDSKTIEGFFDSVTNLKDVNTFETMFKQRIIKMMETPSSYAEMLYVFKTLLWNIANSKEQFVRDQINSKLPINMIQSAYLQKGIDLNIVDNKVHKKIYTPTSVWDLVNYLTDLGSHPQRYGFSLESGNSSIFNMQKVAGEITFKDQYDLECPVPQLFK